MRIICQILPLLLLLWPMQLAAKPLRLSSDNFVLQGDLGEAKAQELLTDLELFRESVFYFLEIKPAPEPVPVKFYVAKNDKELKEISGVSGFAGLYRLTHKGPSLLMNGRLGFGRKGQGRHIALHEFSHHLTSSHSRAALPLWYNEGLANYLATFTYKDGVFHIGRPYEEAAIVLSDFDWMPIEVILKSVSTYPFADEQENTLKRSAAAQQYYAQSWLMAHYLQSDKERRARVSDYLSKLKSGQDSLTAFEAAFEMSPDEFQEKLRAYHKKGDFDSRIISRPPQPLPLITAEKLTREKLQLAKLSARRDFSLHSPRSRAGLEAVEKYERKYGISAQSLKLKADLTPVSSEAPDSLPDSLATAYGFIEQALALEPDDVEAQLIAARLIILRQIHGSGTTAEQRALARQYVIEALEENPRHPLGLHVQRLILAQAP